MTGQSHQPGGNILTSAAFDPSIRDILFIRLRLLGDIIFTIPAIELFKRRFPDARLHYVVEERFAEIAGIIPGVDDVIVVPARRGCMDILAFRRKIKSLGIQTVVDFHSGPGSAVLALASGAACRIGYRTPNRNWAYHCLVDRKGASPQAHSVHNQARLLEKLGIAIDDIPPYPVGLGASFPPPARLAAVRDIHPRVVVHLGAGNRFRDWGGENFSALIRRLSDRGVSTLLIGGDGEEKARAAALRAIPLVHDFSGPMPARELLALIAGAEAYVGADSGPLHMASLTATPLVALYGPNLAEISGPWRKERVEIVQLEMACRPCSQRRCKYGTIPCMRNIGVDKVYETVGKFIQ
jgi:ADP-heptose:LPS heptosyltransferase